MSNMIVKDGLAAAVAIKADGTGQTIDPYIPHHIVDGPVEITAEALPLPDGAATSDLQTSGNTILNSILIGMASVITALASVLKVGGTTATTSSFFARPADVTPYTALDTVANATSGATVLTFGNAARLNAGSGYITKARLITDQPTCVARFRLHLYAISPTALQDNAPFLTDWTNRTKGVGSIDFSALAQEAVGGTAASNTNQLLRLPFVAGAGSTALFGILESLDAFTPANGQNFHVELTVEQN